MSTKKQIKALVASVQIQALGLDDLAYDEIISDEWLESNEPFDDGKIGGDGRKAAAAALRMIRSTEVGRAILKREIDRIRKSMLKNPRRWGFMDRPAPRLHPKTVTRKASPAKRHRDCCYCGTGWSDSICGACKEAGIDGRVIRGTEAKKASTFIVWK